MEDEKSDDDKDNKDLIVFSTSPVVITNAEILGPVINTESDTRIVRIKEVKMSETLKNKIKFLNDNSLGGQDTDLSQIKSEERAEVTASKE